MLCRIFLILLPAFYGDSDEFSTSTNNLKLIGVILMAKSKIKPLSDRVLVQPEPAEEKTSSGIIIPDTAKEKPQEGTVVAAGPGKVENGTKIDMSVKEGDKVLYGKYSGTEITLDGDEYLIMREADILGIVS